MIELLNNLINKQSEIDQIELERGMATEEYDNEIKYLSDQIVELKEQRDLLKKPYDDTIEDIMDEQSEVKTQILKMWDGKKKTLKFDTGTLKFRTTTSLDIRDPSAILEDMMTHLSTPGDIIEYISGFNKTAVKKYMSVHKMRTDAIELVPKTTVSFDG